VVFFVSKVQSISPSLSVRILALLPPRICFIASLRRRLTNTATSQGFRASLCFEINSLLVPR
jgi:hypothetical protein